MDKLKYIKLENEDGSYGESIPLAVDADHVDINGVELSNILNTYATKKEVEIIASGSPAGVYATVSELTAADPDHSKIYIVGADGKWYYYNNDWVAGGIYQAATVEDFSIDYQKINPFKNGIQNIFWQDGYIASAYNNTYAEGYINIDSSNGKYKRSAPIAMTKGMTLIYKTCALAGVNALSRVNSNNEFIATIEAGSDNAGYRVRTYTCQNEYELVCIQNITQYCSNPIVNLYATDFNLDELVTRENNDIVSALTNGFLADSSSSYGANILVLSQSASSTRRITNYIKVKKGQWIYTNAANNNTSIDTIGLFNNDFTYNKTILQGYNNSQLNNTHYYEIESNGYIVIFNDISLVSATDLVIKLYNSFDELYKISGYQKIFPTWKGYYINATTSAITPTTTSYNTTEKIPLKEGDVITGITLSTTDGAPKIAISDGINYKSLVIINNTNADSQYYDPSYAFNYIATKDCFIEILNRIDTLPQAETQIYINPMSNAISNVYSKKFCAIGDSYVKNQNDNCGYTWMSLFANKYGAYYYMRGIGGTGLVEDNSFGLSILHRLNTIPTDSDFILIVGGKNDYNNQTTLATFKSGVAEIIETIQNDHPTAKMMFATPWNSIKNDTANIKLKDYADTIEEVCKEYCVPVFNSFYLSNMYLYDAIFRTNYSQAANDVSHLNKDGHIRMLGRVETFLKSI